LEGSGRHREEGAKGSRGLGFEGPRGRNGKAARGRGSEDLRVRGIKGLRNQVASYRLQVGLNLQKMANKYQFLNKYSGVYLCIESKI
jgi:hypothetical protein